SSIKLYGQKAKTFSLNCFSGRAIDGTLICYPCGRMGHFHAACPNAISYRSGQTSNLTRNTWERGGSQGQTPGSSGVSNSQQPGRTESIPQRVNSQQVAARVEGSTNSTSPPTEF
uniref:CCHC-type domain-containing protein n=1 Tax=Romanomermis culicivorax TaxID=13658 RepID=A0A915KFC2_ROMCU